MYKGQSIQHKVTKEELFIASGNITMQVNKTSSLREMIDLRYSYNVMVQFKFQRLIIAANKLILKSRVFLKNMESVYCLQYVSPDPSTQRPISNSDALCRSAIQATNVIHKPRTITIVKNYLEFDWMLSEAADSSNHK
jgi:hypothetical protein